MKFWCCFGFDEEENELEEEKRRGSGMDAGKAVAEAGESSSTSRGRRRQGDGNGEAESSRRGEGGGGRGIVLVEELEEEILPMTLDVHRFVGEVGDLTSWIFGGNEIGSSSSFGGNVPNFDQQASGSGQRNVSFDAFGRNVDHSGQRNALDALGFDLNEDPQDQEFDSERVDTQNKRARIQGNQRERRYALLHSAYDSAWGSLTSHVDGGVNLSLGSSIPAENKLGLCVSPNPSNWGAGESLQINAGTSDTLKIEDAMVRMDLTDDLLHMVFSFLGHIDLCRAGRVCRQWRVASSHEDFWRFLNFENRHISAAQFADMCRRYPNATALNIFGAPSLHSLAVKAIASLRNLETLILGKGQVGDAFFHSLGDCAALKNLSVIDATLGNGIQEIPVHHDRLRRLQIIKCRVLRISVRCPQLEILSLKRTNMAHAMLQCPQLHDLDIGSCHKLSDAGIRSAATSCPLLTSLDISNCSCVTDETLREIALTCVNLRVLNASYCPNISLESVRLPMLTLLKLDNCEGITSASMTAISHSFMLEVLELDNCGLLTSVSLDLPHLQNIRLVHCRKFVDLNLKSPALSSITVSNCPALHRINITSSSLQKLILHKQESLINLSLQCQCLQEVDLTECESLTNSVCEVFCDRGGCPMLRSLILESCESLTDVKLSSTSLVSLSLVGCRAMTSLDLACPYLGQVQLDGCDHLERASFCPVGLRALNLGICPKLNVLQIEAPNMVVLELKGCGVLSEACIYCPLLTSLDASFCSQLTDDCLSATTASCPLIESLILMSCPSVGPDGLSSLRCLVHLTLLDLSYTFLTNLQPVFESCLELKVLKLQACKYLTDSSLKALYKDGALPALRELDLSYGTLGQSAIEELLSCCTHLTHVSLNGCLNMHDLNWNTSGNRLSELCSSGMSSVENFQEPVDQPNRLLQNLNCVGCPNIKKVTIPAMACCFHMLSLNLSLSANLKEVDISCYNLSFFNLSNCCSLEILKLECPKLTSLFLQSCNITEEAVEVAIAPCSMLETLDVRFCPKIFPVNMGRLRVACPSLKRIFSSLPVS